MVGMATRANNYHIQGAGIGCSGKTLIVCGYSIEKIVNEWGQKLHRGCREDFEPMTVQLFFFKWRRRVPRLGVQEVCSSISPHGQKKHRPFVEDGLVLAIFGRCALVDGLGVGGGRIQTG